MFSFGRYLRKRLLDCFHIAYTHPSGDVDVPFGGCDFRPNFLPLILRPLLTLIADDKLIFRTIARKAFAGLFAYCHTHPLGGVDVPFGGL